jgi:hypothetical protein
MAALVLIMAGGAVLPATGATTQAGAPHHPRPAQFTHGRVDNEWFPLKPGNRLVYRGSEDGVPLKDVFFVTYSTRVIDGVRCRVVRDRVFERGILRERTTDWYAQTKTGTVWYFGENTALLNRRGQVVSREGSFRSGRDGAEAGIFMPARPRVGDAFVQESYPGHAQDRFRVLSFRARTTSPAVASRHAMLTKETTPLEPDVVDHKYYVRDIGTVTEKTVRGGDELLKLTSLTHVARGR